MGNTEGEGTFFLHLLELKCKEFWVGKEEGSILLLEFPFCLCGVSKTSLPPQFLIFSLWEDRHNLM